jgi:hypothetical protein
MRLTVLGGTLLLAACATNSGVISIAPNTYVVSRQAATGFGGMGNLRAEALQEAGAACTKQGKTLRVVSEKEAPPPYLLGNYPRIDVTFACDKPSA